MNAKLRCILLIDDNEADNFLHQTVIEDSGLAERVVAVTSGREALDFLTTREEDGFPRPDIIFLDINMPEMNGWQFFEEYEKLDVSQRANVVVVMLTTSLNPADRERADQLGLFDSFLNKPLTEEALEAIVNRHFG